MDHSGKFCQHVPHFQFCGKRELKTVKYGDKICHHFPQLSTSACFKAYRSFKMRNVVAKFCQQIPQKDRIGHCVDFGVENWKDLQTILLLALYQPILYVLRYIWSKKKRLRWTEWSVPVWDWRYYVMGFIELFSPILYLKTVFKIF